MKNALISAGVVVAVIAGCATTQGSDPERQREAVETMKQSFHARGIAKMNRLNQDELQRVCTDTRDQPPANVQKRLEAAEMAEIKLPADGKFLGGWKRGEKIASIGRGMTWRDKPGRTSRGEPNGGGCYNCHELSPKVTSFGSVGPSLRQFGKKRGYGVDIQKYAYMKIYNAKAFSICSTMPRFGPSGTLTEQQMKDLTAYLMDPKSPVNK
ncbi:MAG: sulfur oxidation c-type cytochrome SoxX [Betaproteobacteria bacterium]|nr:sulfur oxidation c-type cytochrome SoxX [Betaproteobacteria bacterium]MDH3436129.1 sulfur oxidation c-type cytochrome SoxX [Betaproteobacteria bacterium]